MEDSHIRQNQLNQTTQERSGLPLSEDENWLKQKANEIKRKRADMKKNNPDELNELPSVFDRLQEIEKRDLRIKGDSKLIYAFIYKDLSEAVHFSIKTIHELRFLLEDSASQESSFFWSNKCLDASGGFFIYITQLWNGTFEVIPEFSFLKWQADWTSSQSRARQVLAGG